MQYSLQYHPGFGNEVSTEALPNALPKGQVSGGCMVEKECRFIATSSLRTIHRRVPMACTVSSSLALPSPALGGPTRGGVTAAVRSYGFP